MKRNNNGRKLLVYVGTVAALITAMSLIVSAAPLPPQNDVIVNVTPDSQTGRSGDTLTYTVNLTNNGTVHDIIVVDSITGVPAGWVVELKDAGVPQGLPYSTSLLASKMSQLLTLDSQIPANTIVNATITINIHSYANQSVTDSDIFECLVSNNPPVLSSGEVSPASGNATTTFTYSVNYTDADNHTPYSINVTIDGTSYPMNAITGQDGNYTNGEIYEYTTTGAVIGVCSHTFQFNASDGMDYATGDIGVHSSPIILDTDLSNVELISADINVICINVSSSNLSTINETHKPADATSQSAYLINSTGAGNFTLRFTAIAANMITVYKINATNHWIALDTTTTTDTVTFTMDVEYPPVVVVFGTTPEETIAHHSGGGGEGVYPPGWFETSTPSMASVLTEAPTPVPTEKPAMTPTESPTPSTAVSSPSPTPTETPTTKLATKGIPGFESVYVIAGMLTVAYLTFRRRWR